MKHIRILFFVFLCTFSSLSAEEPPEILYRFSFVGCNRVGFGVDLRENPSTANVEQLRNTFNEIPDMTPKPTHLFMLGDLILGYTSWLSTVDQLQGWLRLYRQTKLATSRVTLVPVVGNHEMLLSSRDESTGQWTDYPNPPAAKAWRYIMKPLLKWTDGPTLDEPNHDRLLMSQDNLSFTVRDQGILFILLNTDTFVDNITIGDIPLHWLETKLNEGQSDPTIEHIFVMGHKPLVKPDLEAEIVRDEEIEPALKLLSSHSKVRALLTAHYHLWDFRLMPGGVPQVIAGNGGSVLKGPFADPKVGYYGYTIVDILSSGDIEFQSWGRPVPTPYDSGLPQPPATLRETRRITFAPL